MPLAARLIAPQESKLATTAVTAARPSGAGDGVDIASWRTTGSGSFPASAVLFLDGSAGLTLSSPTGGTEGPEIWGYRGTKWYRCGVLNNGTDVVLVGASQGFATEASILGFFERLAIAGTPSVGSVTATLVPLQEWMIP